jgi:hypothetical protein
MDPRDGTEIGEKTPRILEFFDFSSFEIPPKTPPLKCGCCREPGEFLQRRGDVRARQGTRKAT